MLSTGRFTSELKALKAQSYDRCRSCGSILPRDAVAYAGYDSNDLPLYVGLCCLEKIAELASHIYWWWEVDKRVVPETKLWRYMDLAKFISLLESKQLYFARADTLGDPFEGASGVSDREEEWDNFYLNYFRNAVRNPPEGAPAPPETVVEENARQLLSQIRDGAVGERNSTFVSCWHANTGESEALWRLYCPPGSSGVAIQTTAERLESALGHDGDIRLGHVQYIDFRKSFAGFHDRIFWKRSSLTHEAEVRAVIADRFFAKGHGIARNINVEVLCGAVVPSPFAPDWFEPLLRSIVDRYGFEIQLNRSELLAQPFF